MILLTVTGVSTSARPQQQQEPAVRIEVDVTGAAIVPKTRDQWGEIRSKNFVVAGDADERDLRLAASELELFRSVFARLFPRASEGSSVGTRVIVFRDSQSLKDYRPLEETSSDKPYLRRNEDLNYIVLHANDKLSAEIQREYARLLMRDSIGPLPLWLETGLVEYFSAYKLTRLGDDRMVKLGLDEYKGISEKEVLPLDMLFRIDQDSFLQLDKEVQKIFLAQSSLLFQYLLQTRRLTAAIRMANAIAEGDPVDTAIRSVFKVPTSILHENLKHHIRMSKFDGWSVTFTALTNNASKRSIRLIYGQGFLSLPTSFDTIRADAERVPMRVLSAAEATAYRGDLQLHNGRIQEAEALLLQAIRESATLASAHASLGFALALQKDYKDAFLSLDKARRLDPSENALGYYYTAWAIREGARNAGAAISTGDLHDMKTALSDAVDIAPRFVPAAEMLGETQLLLGQDLNAAAKSLIDAMKYSLGRQTLMLTLARVTTAAGEKAVAGWMLQRVIASGGTTPNERKEARTLLASLNLTAAQKTAFANFDINESSDAGSGSNTKVFTKKDIKAANSKKQDTKIVRGYLTEVKCDKGITIYIQIGVQNMDERVENLHSDSKEIEWFTDTGEVLDAVKCEKRPSAPVAITYIPKRKGLMMGVPLVVEFCRGASFDCDFKRPPR